jgi:hypothetical protein
MHQGQRTQAYNYPEHYEPRNPAGTAKTYIRVNREVVCVKQMVYVVPKQYAVLYRVDGFAVIRLNRNPAVVSMILPMTFVGYREDMRSLKAIPNVELCHNCHVPRYNASAVSLANGIAE